MILSKTIKFAFQIWHQTSLSLSLYYDLYIQLKKTKQKTFTSHCWKNCNSASHLIFVLQMHTYVPLWEHWNSKAAIKKWTSQDLLRVHKDSEVFLQVQQHLLVLLGFGQSLLDKLLQVYSTAVFVEVLFHTWFCGQRRKLSECSKTANDFILLFLSVSLLVPLLTCAIT